MEARRKPKLRHLGWFDGRKGDHTLLREINQVKVGICEVNGNASSRDQEDTYITDASEISKAFMELSPEQRKLVVEKTFADLQEGLGEEQQGSCACIATGQVKEGGKAVVSTSYVGDSVAFLIILDANGRLKRAIACNPVLHYPDNAGEKKAITEGNKRKKGLVLEKDGIPRLYESAPDSNGNLQPVLRNGRCRSLAMTRAFGDFNLALCGLSHIPETTEITIEGIDSTDRVFMVVTCDGAMEHCQNDPNTFANELGQLFQKHHTSSPELLAEKIVDHGLAKDSMDNITAMVTELVVSKQEAAIIDGPAASLAVFDGHGGARASNFLKQNYLKRFRTNIESFLGMVLQQAEPELTSVPAHSETAAKPSGYSMWPRVAGGILGGAGGAVGGMFLGGMIGSIVPVIGTTIGAIAGAVIGGLVGGVAGAGIGYGIERFARRKQSDNKPPPSKPAAPSIMGGSTRKIPGGVTPTTQEKPEMITEESKTIVSQNTVDAPAQSKVYVPQTSGLSFNHD